MSEAQPGINDDAPLDATREELLVEIFAHLVIQNTNMALMFLGAMPHPETGERVRDVEAAQMFIAQLEMLEVKTVGNLAPEEQKLLQQSLRHLRMTFVQALDLPSKPEEGKAAAALGVAPAPAAAPAPGLKTDSGESSKRFSKKF